MTLSARIVRRVAGALAAAALAAAPATADAPRRVNVGGYRLNLHCVGEGTPVVVLDAGAGDTSEVWQWVVPGVREFTRVCVYDRAGLGRSDDGPVPRTSDRIVVELKALLSRAGIRGPYVLGGHSFGGLNMRLYAALHPEEVVGVVLIDATPEDFPAREASLRTRWENEKLLTDRSSASPTYRAEVDGIAASVAAVRAAAKVTAPVVVLTAGHETSSPQFRATWLELQIAMTRQFPKGRQIIAGKSGHYIQFDRPDVVVTALRDLVEASRSAAAPPSR